MSIRTHIALQEESIQTESGMQIRDIDPVAPFENQLWLNTSTFEIKIFKNGQVVVLSSPVPSTILLGNETISWHFTHGTMYKYILGSNTTFDFINLPTSTECKTIVLAVENPTGSDYDVDFSASVNLPDQEPIITVSANTKTVFTFISVNGELYGSYVSELGV